MILLHRCHAVACPREVPPNLLMCPAHWRLVPKTIQFRVWAAYKGGQEERKDPSLLWCIAADAAVRAVAEKEGRQVRVTFQGAFYPPGAMAATGMGRTVRGER